MAMSQEHKTLLTRNRLRLIREVIPNHELYAVLQENHTLTPTMVEEIESVKTTQGKVGKLLDILPRRGGVAFPTFIKALEETHQEQLATLLDSSYTSSSPSSRVVSQPKDSGPGGDQLTPSATSSSTDLNNELGKWSSGKQPQQPSDALSGKFPSIKVRDHEQQPSHENAAPRAQSIKGWTVEEDIMHLVYDPNNQGFIYETCELEDGEEPGKTGSLRDGRCVIFRNEMIKKHGYDKNFDDVNLSMAFKMFGIKVETTFENKSPKEIFDCLHKETKIDTSAFFLFMFAPGSGDYIATENGDYVSTFQIIDIVRNSVALKGKPKVLIFHLSDSGPMDKLDSVAEPANSSPSLEFSALTLNTEGDNLAILKVASSSSDDLKVHWLVSSLIFLMTKYAKKHDLCKILDYVKRILERKEYSVTLNSTLKSGLYFTS